jgi:hypothetical protein
MRSHDRPDTIEFRQALSIIHQIIYEIVCEGKQVRWFKWWKRSGAAVATATGSAAIGIGGGSALCPALCRPDVQSIHRKNFDANHLETASLLSIKTGACPEDCGNCSQSAPYDTGLNATRPMNKADAVATAQQQVVLVRT